MRWIAKALVQKALSYAPASDSVNYLVQRRVLKSLPASDAHVRQKFRRATQHYDTFVELASPDDPSAAVFYEFGVGWDLLVPLAYFMLGVERQILVDLHPHARPELINDSIRRLEAARASMEEEAARSLGPLGTPAVAGTEELEARFGFTYRAPCDARATGFPSASVDFVSSTDTLEHIPRDDIARILAECRRLLEPDGLLSCRIDLEDHYSRFDRSVTRYNFLRYSDRAWALANSSLHYQNRLRYPEYVRLVEEAGFEVVQERVSRASEQQLVELSRIEPAPRFRGFTLEELGVRGATIIARPVQK